MRSLNKILMTTVATCALSFGFNVSQSGIAAITAAHAQESGHSGGSHSTGGDHSSDSHSGGHKGGSGKGQGRSSTGSQGKGGVESHVFEEDEGPSDEAKGPKYGGGRATTGKPSAAGTKKGDLVSDMWVILRDANGVPILNANGFVQPLDASGNLIPLNAEGEPIDESLAVEVEIGRTNVARSPSKVLDRRLDEAVANINAADFCVAR